MSDQIYPAEREQAALGYLIYFYTHPENIGVQFHDSYTESYKKDKNAWGLSQERNEYGLYSWYEWFIPIDQICCLIDMNKWNKFIQEAFTNPNIPHMELASKLTESFTWQLPNPKFIDIDIR